jgi:hypothetical protein
MLTVATCFWDANRHSYPFSRCYDESWVEKLYRGFERNLTVPFRFVCFTDRERVYSEPIEQEPLIADEPDCGSLVEPYRLNEPMILVGLDTLITGNIDHLAEYALNAETLALTRDPYAPQQACTGVALVPKGHAFVWETYDGNPNDMVHLRKQPHVFIEDMWPGHVRSYKVHVAGRGWLESRIIYFHGRPKMDGIPNEDFVREHWR